MSRIEMEPGPVSLRHPHSDPAIQLAVALCRAQGSDTAAVGVGSMWLLPFSLRLAMVIYSDMELRIRACTRVESLTAVESRGDGWRTRRRSRLRKREVVVPRECCVGNSESRHGDNRTKKRQIRNTMSLARHGVLSACRGLFLELTTNVPPRHRLTSIRTLLRRRRILEPRSGFKTRTHKPRDSRVGTSSLLNDVSADHLASWMICVRRRATGKILLHGKDHTFQYTKLGR